MLVVHQVVKLLGVSHRYRQEETEKPVEWLPLKIRVMNEVVSDPVNVPRDAYRIDQSHRQQYPPGRVIEHDEHENDIGSMQQSSYYRDPIVFGIRQNLHITVDSVKRIRRLANCFFGRFEQESDSF